MELETRVFISFLLLPRMTPLSGGVMLATAAVISEMLRRFPNPVDRTWQFLTSRASPPRR